MSGIFSNMSNLAALLILRDHLPQAGKFVVHQQLGNYPTESYQLIAKFELTGSELVVFSSDGNELARFTLP